MDLKKRLARDIVTYYHSAEAAEEAEARFEREVQRRRCRRRCRPSPCPTAASGRWWICCWRLDLVASKGEARRLVEQGSVQVDGEKVDPKAR